MTEAADPFRRSPPGGPGQLAVWSARPAEPFLSAPGGRDETGPFAAGGRRGCR